MLGRSCCLVPFGGLVAEVVRFKMAKAILLVILLIVALNSCGQWFLASRTFSNTPAKTFRDKGCIRWRVTGFGTLLLTTVVSPIVSEIKWRSSKAIWGDTVALSRERFWGGTLAATDLVADVLSQVKLLPGKLATICFTLPVWMATATQWWLVLLQLKKLQEQGYFLLFKSCTFQGSEAPLSTKNEPVWKPSRKALLWIRA